MKSLLSWVQSQEGFYLLTSPVRVLILYTTVEREGADVECRFLEEVLPEFEVRVTKRRNLSAHDMLKQIRETASEEDSSGLLVAVMGHGVKGAVWAKDELVRIQDILISMNQKVLEGKPKVSHTKLYEMQMTDSLVDSTSASVSGDGSSGWEEETQLR